MPNLSDLAGMGGSAILLPDFENPGRLDVLPISKLTSGLAYQRPLSEKRVNDLVENWDKRLLEPLVVSQREGKYFLIDGQNRITAMRRKNKGRDAMAQCIIFTGLSYEEEAELCLKLAHGKRPLTLGQSINAIIQSGKDPEPVDIRFLLSKAGLRWTLEQSVRGRYNVNATRAVINAYRRLGRDAFFRMLTLQVDTWRGEPASLRAFMFEGMSLFLKTYEDNLSDRTFTQRIAGYDANGIIRRAQSDTSTNRNGLRCARVLLELYNKNCRGPRRLDGNSLMV